MIEKLVEIGNLFDFYGNLLSENQYKVIELFYLKDLSLTEIGEILGITRQGVYDNLKRAEDNLYRYEEELQLYAKFNNGLDNIRKIIEIIEKLDDDIEDQYIKKELNKINKLLYRILKDSWEVER